MKNIILALMLLSLAAIAQGVIEAELRDTPEMTERCLSNISYFESKVEKYESKSHLSAGQKIKIHYYKSELESWEDYCLGDSADPDFSN
jgi:hypothetical protein